MNPTLKDVWKHMRDLGLGALAHANRHAAYIGMENKRWPELSVLQAAHAAELLIKARIAQEHPLLIFDQLPRSTNSAGPNLNLVDLFQSGRTVQWADLPERLWASTGLTITNRARYDSFGKLRNGLQHFGAVEGVDFQEETLRFVFEVVDPLINQWWKLFAIDYDEDCEPYIYFVHAVISREIPFLVSAEAAEGYDNWQFDWDGVSETYKTQMEQRVQEAQRKAQRAAKTKRR